MSTAFLLALVPVITAFATSGSVEGAFATLTVTQWATLGVQAIAAGPQAIGAVKSLGAAIHPLVEQFADDLAKNRDAHGAAHWLVNNVPPMIPGYQADGSVGEIPNPDNT